MRKTTPFTTKLCSAQRLTSEKKCFLKSFIPNDWPFPAFVQSTVKSFSLPTKKVSSGPNPSISTFDASPLGLTWTLNGLFGTLLPPYLTSTLWRPGRSGTYSTEYVPSPLSLTSTSRSGPVGGATEAEMRSKGESLVKKKLLDILEAMESVRFGMK